MPIDAEKLMRFHIPVVRQDLTPRDVAFYALSVGMGREAGDVRQLRYIDPRADIPAMPSLVLVLAHPGFWLGNPESGVDPLAVLHAAQRFEIKKPIPVSGMIESRTRITRLVDKGDGKAALIYTQTDLLDGDGAEFAQLDRTTFIRGGGGFGGSDVDPERAQLSELPEPDFVIDLETGREQALLYRLNGDLNPLHSDPEIARKAGFDRPILHGLCTMGVVTHALLRGLGDYNDRAIRSISLRFSNPVFPGETVRTEIWHDGRFRAGVPSRGIGVAVQGHCQINQKEVI